jgi:hypothetical protein
MPQRARWTPTPDAFLDLATQAERLADLADAHLTTAPPRATTAREAGRLACRQQARDVARRIECCREVKGWPVAVCAAFLTLGEFFDQLLSHCDWLILKTDDPVDYRVELHGDGQLHLYGDPTSGPQPRVAMVGVGPSSPLPGKVLSGLRRAAALLRDEVLGTESPARAVVADQGPGVDPTEGPAWLPLPAGVTPAPTPVSRPTLKPPPDAAVKAYRLKFILGAPKQAEIARRLSQELGKPVRQGQVSRWLRQAEAFVRAGGVLPGLPDVPSLKPIPVDPERLDLGPRQDGRTERQRGRRSADD